MIEDIDKYSGYTTDGKIYRERQMVSLLGKMAKEGKEYSEYLNLLIWDGNVRREEYYTLPAYMMAVHLKMYEEALILLDNLNPSSMKAQMSSKAKNRGKDWVEGFWGACVLNGAGQVLEISCFTIGDLLMAHSGIPGELVSRIWEKYKETGCRSHILEGNYRYRISFIWPDKPESRTGVFLSELTQMNYLNKCCPGIVYGFYSDYKTSIWDYLISDETEARQQLSDYNKVMRLLEATFEGSPQDQSNLYFGSGIEFSGAEPADIYVKYKSELLEYFRIRTRFAGKIRKPEINRLLAEEFLTIAAFLYVVWTNRSKVNTPDERKAAYEMTCEIAPMIKLTTGDDPARFLYEEFIENKGYGACQAVNAMGTLIKNVAGKKIEIDISEVVGRKIMIALFDEASGRSSAACGPGQVPGVNSVWQPDEEHTLALMEVMEIIETVRGYGKDIAVDDEFLHRIMEDILEIGNIELLESALRKGLIPSHAYGEMITMAVERRPLLLPPLIAYHEALEVTGDGSS